MQSHKTTNNASGSASPHSARGRTFLAQPASLGLCFLLSLQHQLSGFLFPPSASVAISPLFMSAASAILLLAYCYFTYRRDSSTFSVGWSILLSIVAATAAVIAGAFIAEGDGSEAASYAAAVVTGLALAALTYAWASVYARLSARDAILNAITALLAAGALDFAGMHAAALVGAWPSIFVCGVGACATFVVSIRKSAALDTESSRTRPVLYLPQKMKEHTRLVCGIALYAFALGVVAGTTAANSTSDSMGSLNASVNRLSIVASLVLLAATITLRKRITLATLIHVLTPALVAVFLLNIVVPDYAGILLACTFFGWMLLQVFTFLLASHIARQRIASLSLAFPIVWSLVLCGNAAGILSGQLYVGAYGNDQQAVFVMAVILTVVVVAASSLLMGNASVVLATPRRTEAEEARDNEPPAAASTESMVAHAGAARATEAPTIAHRILDASTDSLLASTPFEAACAALAQSHNLSERETEVFAMLARGYTRTSIAKKLFVSENTVRVHVKNVYAKLYVHSKQQLIDLVDAKADTR